MREIILIFCLLIMSVGSPAVALSVKDSSGFTHSYEGDVDPFSAGAGNAVFDSLLRGGSPTPALGAYRGTTCYIGDSAGGILDLNTSKATPNPQGSFIYFGGSFGLNANTGWTTGMAIEFDPTEEATTIIGNSPRTWHDEGVKMGRDATLVYGRRQLIIDSPTANAFIGWPTASTHTFESGLVIEDLEPGRFVTVAVVSMDRQPLTTSDHLMLSALRGSENTGFVYDPEATESTGYQGMLEGVVEIGGAPVVFDRPEVTIQLPNKRSGTASLYNAFPEVFATEEVSGTFRFDGEQPTAWVEVSYE